MKKYRYLIIESNQIQQIVKNLSPSQIVNYNWDKIAFGFSIDDTITIPLSKLKVKYKGDTDNVVGFFMRDYFKNKSFSSLLPIEVIYEKGKFFIDDGHHRYGYAKELKLKNVKVKVVSIKDNPVIALGFKNIDGIIKVTK